MPTDLDLQVTHSERYVEQKRESIKGYLTEGFRKPGIWWAEEIVARAKRGERIKPACLKVAVEAIESKGGGDEPVVNRVPGSDDDL